MYMVILLGNSTLIILTLLDSRFHTPMYFFLSNLSFLDILYTSSFIPSTMIHFLTQRKKKSPSLDVLFRCLSPSLMASTECVLLAVMAYDRYVAICIPWDILSSWARHFVFRWQLSHGDWAFSTHWHKQFLQYKLPFCGKKSSIILFVKYWPFKLACTDISLNEITLMLGNVIFLFVPLLLISISYIFILSTVLRINSAGGRKKAFSTCSAHITVVTMFYGSILFMYIAKVQRYCFWQTDCSLLWSSHTMLNPIIYSLRNTEVHDAMKKLTARQFWKKGWRKLHLWAFCTK